MIISLPYCFDHFSPFLFLHWPYLLFCIKYKVLIFTFKTLCSQFLYCRSMGTSRSLQWCSYITLLAHTMGAASGKFKSLKQLRIPPPSSFPSMHRSIPLPSQYPSPPHLLLLQSSLSLAPLFRHLGSVGSHSLFLVPKVFPTRPGAGSREKNFPFPQIPPPTTIVAISS